jgi:hypothetical protein
LSAGGLPHFVLRRSILAASAGVSVLVDSPVWARQGGVPRARGLQVWDVRALDSKKPRSQCGASMCRTKQGSVVPPTQQDAQHFLRCFHHAVTRREDGCNNHYSDQRKQCPVHSSSSLGGMLPSGMLAVLSPDASGPGRRGRPCRRTADAWRIQAAASLADGLLGAVTMQDYRTPATVPSPAPGIRKARTRSVRA